MDQAYWQRRVRELTAARDAAIAERVRLEKLHRGLDELSSGLAQAVVDARGPANDVVRAYEKMDWRGPLPDEFRASARKRLKNIDVAANQMIRADAAVRRSRTDTENELANVAVRIRSIEYELSVARKRAYAGG